MTIKETKSGFEAAIKSRFQNQRNPARTRKQREGYVLILVVMMLFGIMAIAALTIDIGFARLAQRQMQTAADAAALEGLRYRDVETEVSRRERAALVVSHVFDDDLDGSIDERNFGAGPVVQFSGGAGDASLVASQFMEVPESPVYKPILASNFVDGMVDNSRGDMVAGIHDFEIPNVNYLPEIDSPGINEYVDPNSGEYVGRYFTIPDASEAKNAFLVRIRRTGEVLANDVGTTGPTLPYLFGRGSLMSRQLIADGIRVRATSIAKAVPARAVGRAIKDITTGNDIIGAFPFAIRFGTWQGLPNGTVSTLDLADPTSFVPLNDLAVSNAVSIGHSLPAPQIPSPDQSLVLSALNGAAVNNGRRQTYVPIIANGADVIVGFGFMDEIQIATSNPTSVSFVKAVNRIASENASATPFVAVPAAVLQTISNLNQDLLDHSLLTPTLVR